MKNHLLALLILFMSLGVNAQWINQNVPYGIEGYFYDLEVTDANTVWANVWDGQAATPYTKIFARTIDGGNTWNVGNVTSAPAAYSISNIWPINATTCYVAMWTSAGAGGRVYKTTDGGATWNQVGANMFQSTSSFANIVYFWDANNGLACGDPVGSPLKYEIWLTSDAGVTWNQVPGASLPALANITEYGITNLFSTAQGRFWFGTTYGDVYRSIDMGLTWTKSATGLPAYNPGTGRQDITDLAFSDSLTGLAIQTTATAYLIYKTTDGGLTWNAITPSGGTFYPNDVEGVPGTTTFVSAGSNATFGFGSSFSNDGGLTWTDLDNGVSHTSLDFLDLSTGWSGEYILSGSVGGAFKFNGVLSAISCGDPLINAGVATLSDTIVCWNDTLSATVTSVQAPNTTPPGTYAGFSWLVSTADISGSPDPLNDPSFVGGSGISASGVGISLINNGAPFAPGIYYFTPCVYGNANPNVATPQFVFDLTLDPTCTYSGSSVMTNLLVQGDPLCTVGISEATSSEFSIATYFTSGNQLNILMDSKIAGKATFNLFDLSGRNTMNFEFGIVSGKNLKSVPTQSLVPGTYLLKAQIGDHQSVIKLVK